MKALQEHPVLHKDLSLEWDAFVVLNRARDLGFVEGPIKISEIEAFCNYHYIFDPWYRKKLLKRINLMDSVYLKEKSEKQES